MSESIKFQWPKLLVASSLHDTTKIVGIALWGFTNRNGMNAFPGSQQLAEITHKSLRTVKTHLTTLRELGWIERTSKKNNHPNRYWADVYRLAYPNRVQQLLHSNNVQNSEPGVDRVQLGTDRVQDEADRVQQLLHSNNSFTSIPIHHSDSSESGRISRSSASEELFENQAALPPDWESNFEALESWLEGSLEVEGIDFLGSPRNHSDTALRMWKQNKHPKAIINTILKVEGNA